MKNLIFVFSFFFFAGMLFAQDHVIEIDTISSDFAEPRSIDVGAEEQIQFKTKGAEFAILIMDAYEIFDTDEVNIEILLNSDSPVSAIYTLRERATKVEKYYIIYCITNNKWIDAPPKIVLNAAR